MRERRVTVRFYRALPGAKAQRGVGGWTWPVDEEVGPALAQAFVDNSAKDGWPMTEAWQNTYLVEVNSSASPCLFTVSSVRADQLPLVLKAGATTGEPLSIDDRDSLLEPTYLQFLGENVVAVVGGGPQTPRAGACARALSLLTDIDLKLHPIPQAEIVDMVTHGWGVSTFDFKVAAGSIEASANQPNVIAAADELRNGVDPEFDLKITISAESPTEQRRLRSRVLDFIRSGGVQRVDSAHAFVKGDHQSQLVDLLETQIATQVTVEQESRYRYLTPDDALEAASMAFEAVRVEITRAIAIATPIEDLLQ